MKSNKNMERDEGGRVPLQMVQNYLFGHCDDKKQHIIF